MGAISWRRVTDSIIVKRNEAEAADYDSGMGIIFKEKEAHFWFDQYHDGDEVPNIFLLHRFCSQWTP